MTGYEKEKMCGCRMAHEAWILGPDAQVILQRIWEDAMAGRDSENVELGLINQVSAET
jgi:hypothetical protein